MKEFPLGVAWRALARRPYLCLIPLVWDLLKWGLAAGLSSLNYYFSRWDFAVGWDFQGSGWYARFVLPPALPSVEQLGVPLSPGAPASPTIAQIAVMVGVLALDALVKGGFLHLLNSAIHGGAPSAAKMREGALRYGWRLFVVALVWMGYYSLIATRMAQAPTLLMAANVIVIGLLAAAEFVVVAEDAWPPAAVLGAPFLLWQELGGTLAVVVSSGVASALLTAVASRFGVIGLIVIAPLYAAVGTWIAAGALYALTSHPAGADEVTGQTADEVG